VAPDLLFLRVPEGKVDGNEFCVLRPLPASDPG
jgi:hypothetical protein